MATSINTNYGAAVALQNLNATNAQLDRTQNRVNTGMKVATAKDNGAIFAIATTQRANMGAMDAVKNSLQRGQSIVDVALAAGGWVHAAGTAEIALGLIIAAQRELDRGVRQQAEGVYRTYHSRAVADSRVTVVGVGEIGGAVASRLRSTVRGMIAGRATALALFVMKLRMRSSVSVVMRPPWRSLLASFPSLTALRPKVDSARPVWRQ